MTTSSELTELIVQIDHAINHALVTHPIHHKKLHDAIHYALNGGGKRIRPLFILLIAKMIDAPLKTATYLAVAIECIHTFSLIHDDLPGMDNDDYRRNRPTLHKAYDEATAILAGDTLQLYAIEHLISGLTHQLSADKLIAIIAIFIEKCGHQGMIYGQMRDMNELCNTTLTLSELTTIHTLKTGALFEACMTLPLYLVDSPPLAIDTFATFGQIIGLVFQIQDDYIDYYRPDLCGKKRSSDSVNQKMTFATFYTEIELIEQINHHYTKAKQLLSPLKHKAGTLFELLDILKARTE
jgi:farnesyl diphosphate synthase